MPLHKSNKRWVEFTKYQKLSTRAGLEPTRAKPNRFRIYRLNHSANASCVLKSRKGESTTQHNNKDHGEAKAENNHKRKKDQHQRQGKRRKFQRYWVEDCTELKPPADIKPDVVVTISRVELHDGHTHKTPPAEKTKENDAPEADKSAADEKNKPVQVTKVGAAPLSSPKAPSETQPEVADPATQASNTTPAEEVSIDKAFIAVIRAPSATGAIKKFPHQNFKPLPNGDCGDGKVNPHDKSEVPDKYWAQRKRFFSRFDEGVSLDKEGWYSITPETIANHIAQRVVEGQKKSMIVLDAFCGCGGNAIAFAQRPEVSLVIAVDSDREKLKLAAINAAVYGIEKDKLLLLHGNACEVLQAFEKGKRVSSSSEDSKNSAVELENEFRIGGVEVLPDTIDSVFLSPPWGGMDYEESGKRNYHIETCIQVDASSDSTWTGEDILLASAAATSGPVAYFLPRNLNGISMGRSALKSKYKTIEIEQNILNNKLKTVTVYLGMAR